MVNSSRVWFEEAIRYLLWLAVCVTNYDCTLTLYGVCVCVCAVSYNTVLIPN